MPAPPRSSKCGKTCRECGAPCWNDYGHEQAGDPLHWCVNNHSWPKPGQR